MRGSDGPEAKSMTPHAGIGVDPFGWERLLRGVRVARREGVHVAIWLQAIPFFLVSSEQPSLERVRTVFGGVLAGWCLCTGGR